MYYEFYQYKYKVQYIVLFGILPKELRTAKEGVYVGEDSKIVYPKLSTIKNFLYEQNWIKTAFSIKKEKCRQIYMYSIRK